MAETFWSEERIINSLILMIKEYAEKENKWSIDELNTMFEFYMEQDDSYRKKQGHYLEKECLDCIQRVDLREDYYFIMSFLLYATKSKNVYRMLIKHCIADKEIHKESKFFLYYQFVRVNYVNPEMVDYSIENLMDDLYSEIYHLYYAEVAESYAIIPKEERNQNLVVVFTSQVLPGTHAPTRILLDRCKILEEVLNKKVYIINTAEFLTGYGTIKFFYGATGNYLAELCGNEYFYHEDKQYAFFQCPREMPQVSLIQQILEVVKEEKPYFILTIGGNSIVSDICSNVIPTLTISTVPSEKAMTRGQFQAIGRKISESDYQWMEKHGYLKEHMIEGVFTSRFKEQKNQYTREELGLPKKGFVVVIVGGRLDYEIDEECINMLMNLNKVGIYIAFVGIFEQYDKIVEGSEIFNKYSIKLGFQEDILAVYECCDLYVNPKRVGGGTSVAEALFKGLPVVTTDFGDGGIGAGEDFWVTDYEEMYQQILKYANDKEFYGAMSNKAKERAKTLMDSKTEFAKIIEIMENSEKFK